MIPFQFHAPQYSSPSGYAEYGLSLLCEFHRRAWHVQYAPVWWDPRICPPPEDKVRRVHDLATHSASISPRATIHLRLPDQPQVQPEFFSVLYTMFETDGIPNSWVRDCQDKFDQVWLPSDFNLRTYSRSGIRYEKLKKIRLGIDLKDLCDKPGRARQIMEDAAPCSLFFLATFQDQPRKNPLGLLQMFLKAFRDRSDVALVLKTLDGEKIPGLVKNMREKMEIGEHPRVLYIDGVASFPFMQDLIASCDSYISASHGEGADMNAMKVAAHGKPVVAPFWSGYTEYLKPAGALSIPITNFGCAHNQGVVTDRYYRSQLWSLVDEDAFVETLQKVSRYLRLESEEEERIALKDEIEEVSDNIRQNHSIETVVDSMEETLENSMEGEISPPPKTHVFLSQPNQVIRSVTLAPSVSPQCGIRDAALQLSGATKGNIGFAINPHTAFQQIENHQIDLLHLHYHYGFFPGSRLRLFLRQIRGYGVRIVITLHSTHKDVVENKSIMEGADAVIVHQESCMDDLTPYLNNESASINFQHLHTLPVHNAKSIRSKARKLIGFFGFSFMHKGIREWVMAMEALRERTSNLYGLALAPIHPTPNPTTLHLSEWMNGRSSAGFINVIQDFMQEEHLLQMLSQCSLIVLPYRSTDWTGASAAVRMAMRVKRPILTTDVPFFEDVKEVVIRMPESKVDQPEAFADTMAAALYLDNDQEVAEVIGKFLKKTNVEKMAKETYGIYEKVIGERSRLRLVENVAEVTDA